MSRMYVREAQVTYTRTPFKMEVPRVTSSRTVIDIMRPRIGSNIQESLMVMALDACHNVLGIHEVGRGGIDSCPVSPVDVFRYPLIAGAKAIILAHNHPSGNTQPSSEDIAITKLLAQSGKLLGLPVLDHVIVSDRDESYSFLDSGLIARVS